MQASTLTRARQALSAGRCGQVPRASKIHNKGEFEHTSPAGADKHHLHASKHPRQGQAKRIKCRQ
eukprot:3309849-Karenia_brevis.AAC.1